MQYNELAKQLEILAELDEPVRRRLYFYVAERGGEVSRDEAARGVKVSRALAAFHLDKLVEANLLQASFRRLSGRRGPGAGRPSKLYRRTPLQLDVTLPRRRYELAAHVLASALIRADAEGALGALRGAAREWGRRLGKESAASARGQALGRATRALSECGFEPQGATGPGGDVHLRNCPFDSLRNESRDLTCAMNLALIEGLLEGLGLEEVRARLDSRPGMCCVALRSRGDPKGSHE